NIICLFGIDECCFRSSCRRVDRVDWSCFERCDILCVDLVELGCCLCVCRFFHRTVFKENKYSFWCVRNQADCFFQHCPGCCAVDRLGFDCSRIRCVDLCGTGE